MRLSIACLLAVLSAAPAAAQVRVWIFDDNPEAPALIYGTADSDDMQISFTCEPDEKRMTIVEAVGTKKLEPGSRTTFRLSAGGASVELTGDAIANETDGAVNIEHTGAPNPRVFALLKAGPTLTIEVGGEKTAISLAEAAPNVAEFEKLCFAPGKKK